MIIPAGVFSPDFCPGGVYFYHVDIGITFSVGKGFTSENECTVAVDPDGAAVIVPRPAESFLPLLAARSAGFDQIHVVAAGARGICVTDHNIASVGSLADAVTTIMPGPAEIPLPDYVARGVGFDQVDIAPPLLGKYVSPTMI